MQTYSPLQAIPRAFFSAELYRDVAKNWRGIGFLYFFLVFALCWTPLTIRFYIQERHMAEKQLGLVQQLPDITIDTKGTISTDQVGRVVISDPETNTPIILFDTSKTVAQGRGENFGIFVAHDGILINKPGDQSIIQPQELLKLKSHFSQADYQHYLHVLLAILWYIYGVFLVVEFVTLFILVLLIAFLAWVVTRFIMPKIDFAALQRLAFVCLTPLLLIKLITGLVWWPLALFEVQFVWLSLIIIFCYYIFALMANRSVFISST